MNKRLKRAIFLKDKIKKYYQELKVNIDITRVRFLPDLQRFIYEVKLLPGGKVQTVFRFAADVQFALNLYLFYPFKKGTSIFIAVSEFDVRENKLLKILKSLEFEHSPMEIPLALGYDFMGCMYIEDLAKLLHLLIIGPSGTGKSVALQCIITSMIVRCPVDFVRLILFDVGANSLEVFADVKHLYHPIVKDTDTGVIVLESLIVEMEERISLGERECKRLPFLVCLIDEFDDTIASIEDKEVERKFIASINSIIRRGRKAKVILILASHDPTLKNTRVNINGIISRIAFKCAKHHNSSTALGVTGAENLPGGGAMLFKSQNESMPVPLQGSFITLAEIRKILANSPTGYDDIAMLKIVEEKIGEIGVVKDRMPEKDKSEFAKILFWVLGRDKVSALQIQGEFHIGKRVTEIMDMLYQMGIITDKFFNQPRKVIPTSFEELSIEAVGLLEHYGYGEKLVRKILENTNKDIISTDCL